ncbi:hypothetical protein BG22_00175 [Bifidobacterium sp. UTBIF-78]|nr:hypothetical protein BG22_00175 [Bifidobacterium sp. UTBIF-78]
MPVKHPIYHKHVRLGMTFHITGKTAAIMPQRVRVTRFRHATILKKMIIKQVVHRFSPIMRIPTQPLDITVKPIGSVILNHSASTLSMTLRILDNSSFLER